MVEAGWAPETIWAIWRKEISFASTGIKPRIVQLVAYSLQLLSYIGPFHVIYSLLVTIILLP